MIEYFTEIPEKFSKGIDLETISRIHVERYEALQRSHWDPVRRLFSELPVFGENYNVVDVSGDRVSIGAPEHLSEIERVVLQQAIEALVPWRKGPFQLFGEQIDAEWRSDLKWNRIAPHLDSVEGKRIADIGCANGYYMFRLSAEQPELVVGLDPSERCYYSFHLFQRFVQNPSLDYKLLGVEHMPLFRGFFDIVLCLGILYHHRNPLELLAGIAESMKPGAQLVVESQGIDDPRPIALCPEDRYAKARNVYFIPSSGAIVSWLHKTGFVDIEVISSTRLTTDEQRKTVLSPYESLEDYLDPDEPNQTVEGHPAPYRVAVKARRKK